MTEADVFGMPFYPHSVWPPVHDGVASQQSQMCAERASILVR